MLLPKPEPQRRRKARSKRFEAQLIRAVRKIVEDRDDMCRFASEKSLGGYFRSGCDGVPEWAHFGEYRRFKTRGRPAEERHTTHGSLILCTRHHAAYDGKDPQWTLEITAGDRGCDGPLKMVMRER